MGKQISILSISRDDIGNLQVKLNKDEMTKFKDFVKSIFDDNKNNGGCNNCSCNNNMNQPMPYMGPGPGMPYMGTPAAMAAPMYVDPMKGYTGDQGMAPAPMYVDPMKYTGDQGMTPPTPMS